MAGQRVGWIRRGVILLLILAAGAGIGVYAMLSAPYAGFRNETLIDIPKGAGTRRIAEMLAEHGVIRAPWQLLAVRALRPHSVLQAGEYQFTRAAGVFDVFDRIARGDIFFYEITIPEGSSLFDIAEALEAQGNISAKDFRKAASNPSLIHDLAPQAPTLEGYLFPATYRLTKHTTAGQLCKDMTERFRRAWKSLQSGADVHRSVTLASLVEKETGVGQERPIVASVYVNRIERNMKLDCDPTTIYAAHLEGHYRGTIYRSDLVSQNPYNTYQHVGLPPGPIANPGIKSLEAALHPAETQFLFFVAKTDGSGGHVFTTNVDDHNKAVAEYRRVHQKGKASSPAAPTARP